MRQQLHDRKRVATGQLLARRSALAGLGTSAACMMAAPALKAMRSNGLINLKQILDELYQERATSNQPGNSICIMESGKFYVQALIPHSPELIFLEAVSARFVKDWGRTITKEREALLGDCGFHEPASNSPNYWMEVRADWKYPPEYAAHVATYVFENAFGVRNISDLQITARMPGDA